MLFAAGKVGENKTPAPFVAAVPGGGRDRYGCGIGRGPSCQPGLHHLGLPADAPSVSGTDLPAILLVVGACWLECNGALPDFGSKALKMQM